MADLSHPPVEFALFRLGVAIRFQLVTPVGTYAGTLDIERKILHAPERRVHERHEPVLTVRLPRKPQFIHHAWVRQPFCAVSVIYGAYKRDISDEDSTLIDLFEDLAGYIGHASNTRCSLIDFDLVAILVESFHSPVKRVADEPPVRPRWTIRLPSVENGASHVRYRGPGSGLGTIHPRVPMGSPGSWRLG